MRRSLVTVLVAFAALTAGCLTMTMSAGAYSPIAPGASTSTTGGPTTTAAPTQDNNNAGGGATTTAPAAADNTGTQGSVPTPSAVPTGANPTGTGPTLVSTAKGSTLPFTGGDVLGLILLALLLILIGYAARRAGRRRHA